VSYNPRLNLSRDRFNLGNRDTLKVQIPKRYKHKGSDFTPLFRHAPILHEIVIGLIRRELKAIC
jgi:hypothetical protein